MNGRSRRLRRYLWPSIFAGMTLLVSLPILLSLRQANLDHDLIVAIDQGDLGRVRSSVQRGADVNAPIHRGAALGFPALFVHVWPRTGKAEERHDNVSTPLIDAVRQDRVAIAELLLESGARPGQRDNEGRTALMFIWESTQWRRLYDRLVVHGADINACDNTGVNVIDCAAEHVNWEAVVTLLDAVPRPTRGRVDTRRYGGIMIIATGNGAIDVITKLIELGVDPNYRNRSGYTPLSNAALADDTDVAEVLLTHGALVNAPAMGGGTVMECAREKKNRSMVKLLARFGGK